ncbi:hypothetical protein E9993_05135 [Labilibacter sediminis]|nr:hypothetical protein E9993_05135 [Labilibacter sediminis]
MTSINPSNFYSYFRACYKLDYKEFIVDNLLSVKYKYKWFVSGKEELFSENLPYIPYNNNKLLDLKKDMELYKLEKKLFYGAFFILGQSDNPLVKDKRICAPLILFPAEILSIDGLDYLQIDRESFIVNRSILNKLDSNNSSLTKDLFIKELSEDVIKHETNHIWIKNLLDKYFSNIDTEELLLLPHLWPVSKVKSAYSKYNLGSDDFKIVPAAGTVLVDKSTSSLGVLSDLERIKDFGDFNSSLSSLLNGNEELEGDASSYFKSRLNVDQYQALIKSNNYRNSVIIGPPGTGKSYTITSIVADSVVKGKSVLVVSKTKQAVEVIRAMLEQDFRLREYLIHTTGNKYKISLKAKLKRYLSGIKGSLGKRYNIGHIHNVYEELKEAESDFNNFIEKELKLSDIDFSDSPGLFDSWRKAFIKLSMGNGDKIWFLFENIKKLNAQLDKEIKTYSKRTIEYNIYNNSRKYRKDLSMFYDALDANSFTENKRIIKNVKHENILKVFPVWLANLSDLNSVIPLQKDLFDLVIIDEATQCDMASALPAIYRAKHAVISGDPNQLRHYSFVSHAQQNQLRNKFNLPLDKIFDYRNRSILDFYISKVKDQEQITFLREHFRSTPSLIEFSNQQFYEGQLEVLKSAPKHTESSQIELIELEGNRNRLGINEVEAEAILQKLDDLIKSYENQNIIPSIGIISLFSSQVSYLNKRIREKYELSVIKKFNLICGTPYNFQGSEREIVLISFVVCNNTHHSAFIHANKPEVLNVAITRAKSFQYIFKSVSDDKLNQESLLAGYFSFVKSFIHYNEKEVELDQFQKEVIAALSKKGVQNIKYGYPLGGCLLDILVEQEGINYFIDLIGYPGMFKNAFTLERYKTLSRMGIEIIPLHYSYWKNNKTEIINKLLRFLRHK